MYLTQINKPLPTETHTITDTYDLHLFVFSYWNFLQLNTLYQTITSSHHTATTKTLFTVFRFHIILLSCIVPTFIIILKYYVPKPLILVQLQQYISSSLQTIIRSKFHKSFIFARRFDLITKPLTSTIAKMKQTHYLPYVASFVVFTATYSAGNNNMTSEKTSDFVFYSILEAQQYITDESIFL